MGYRDDDEAARLRVAELESRLAEANARIARLTGEAPPVEADAQVTHSKLLGAPERITLVRELRMPWTDEALEAIAEVLEHRLPHGRASQVGRTLTYDLGTARFTLTPTSAAGARLSLEANYENEKLGVLGVTVPFTFFVAAPLGLLAAELGPLALLLGVLPVSGILGFVLARRLLQWQMRRNWRRLAGAFEAVAERAERVPVGPRVRVAEDAAAIDEDEDTDERRAANEA